MKTDFKWEKCSNPDCDVSVHPVFYKRYNGNCTPKCETITRLLKENKALRKRLKEYE